MPTVCIFPGEGGWGGHKMLKMSSPCSWKYVHVTSRARVWSRAAFCASFYYVMRNYIRTDFSAGQAEELDSVVTEHPLFLSSCAPCLSSILPFLQALACTLERRCVLNASLIWLFAFQMATVCCVCGSLPHISNTSSSEVHRMQTQQYQTILAGHKLILCHRSGSLQDTVNLHGIQCEAKPLPGY